MQKWRAVRLLLICLSLFVCFVNTHARAQQSGHLYKVYNKERRVGFIDRTGKLVIDFNRLPADVRVGDFSEGLASICFANADGSCRGIGFIDETGKVVIKPRFTTAREFSEGLAFVRSKEGSGFINRRGEMSIKLKGIEATEFHEGLAAAWIRRGWGFIDRSGKLITKDEYSRVENFSEGLAAVAVGFGRGAKYGFINKQGETVIPLQFSPPLGHHDGIEFLGRFSEGLVVVKVGNLYGYMDKRGQFVIRPRFVSAREFSEGLASVQTEDWKAGYIDKSGNWVITLNGGLGYNFKEGLAPVAFVKEGAMAKHGYIDRTGKVVIEPRFEGAFEFIDGVAEVYVVEEVTSPSGRHAEGKTAYINRAGNYIWRPQ